MLLPNNIKSSNIEQNNIKSNNSENILAKQFRLGKYSLNLNRPHIMGVLNLTKDSFYDGGRLYKGDYLDKTAALAHAEQMAEEGAAIIDLGAESTRPGSEPVDSTEEQDRVLEILETLNSKLQIPISIDTSNPDLIRSAAQNGASLINDVRALTREGALEAASNSKLPVCLMHIQGEPRTMQERPHYEDVVREVKEYLQTRRQVAIDAGIPADKIILDPGFGFGKSFEHNHLLLKNLHQFTSMDSPLLVGLSRKSFFGEITGREANGRLAATIASTAIAVLAGTWLIRVHDVKGNLDALKLAHCINS
ncbi:MAG: dihydropteroate synthase [Candidatus Portiera sp.]|nr:dihydropteroate synthase [Portiera sp.]